ncbi:GAF domain-containing protein [Dokdonella sp. MW10]|uniref:GAF domain-containing protein n=1 Tax=Dokdonella sp. MW10 TaxID=2992926 RepID=UPI003F800AA5
MAADDERMSLDECAREPIHIPGAIQPHGLLIVIDAASGRITQASDNAGVIAGVAATDLIGKDWQQHVRTARHPLDAAPNDERPLHLAYLPVTFPHNAELKDMVGAWHLYERHWLLEIEPATSHDARFEPLDVHPLLRQVEAERELAAVADRAARALRRLFGYDRVMVYRFDRDWHGEVIAEALQEGFEPYVGLHYPASDIPAQARALYLRNRVRVIADCGYRPVPLVQEDDEPTDLSDVSLRSVSPVHLEYLGNMGVKATLVLSIIVNERLWGLVACHHYAPLFADHAMRDAADLISRALAARIGAVEQLESIWRESRLLSMREDLISHFNGVENLTTDGLRDFAPELLEAVEADGVALIDERVSSRYGVLPPDEVLLDLRRRIRDGEGTLLRSDTPGVIYSDEVAKAFPDLDAHTSTVAGVLYIPLDAQSRSAILWTRVEQVRTVRWGGNPYLAKLQVYPGARLSPRQSFSAWQEEVKGRSLPWEPIHLESARALRILVELLDRRHYQAGFGMLHATLDSLHAPLFIMTARRGDMPAPEIVHVNDAFRERTGIADHAAIIRRWELDSERFNNWLGTGTSFRAASVADGESRDPRWEIIVQPLPPEAGRDRYICVLERSLLDP